MRPMIIIICILTPDWLPLLRAPWNMHQVRVVEFHGFKKKVFSKTVTKLICNNNFIEILIQIITVDFTKRFLVYSSTPKKWLNRYSYVHNIMLTAGIMGVLSPNRSVYTRYILFYFIQTLYEVKL